MIYTREEFKELRNKLSGVVFTNGCFDILHRGHIEYLNQAKSLGKYLIIGLNSDSSVKRLKGEDRPVNKESDRGLRTEQFEMCGCSRDF